LGAARLHPAVPGPTVAAARRRGRTAVLGGALGGSVSDRGGRLGLAGRTRAAHPAAARRPHRARPAPAARPRRRESRGGSPAGPSPAQRTIQGLIKRQEPNQQGGTTVRPPTTPRERSAPE